MEKLKELVDQFRYNLKDYTSWNFNETNTRQQFIDKFFELLGRDVNNHFWRSEQYKEVVLEDKLKIWWQAKAPDYSFRLGGRRIFFVEAKKPSVNIKDDVEPAYQIRRYSWTAKLPIGILTDFEELAIYDTRVKPNPKDKAGTARIKYFNFEELEENREWIYNTLSKDAVEKWALDRYIQESKKKWTQSVDVDFLNMIDDRRDALAKNIYLRYEQAKQWNWDLDRLNNIVGDIVDKIIFLRIDEDKKIENLWNLENIANWKEIWKNLISYFEKSDKKYNSWLFDNTEIFKKFELDDKILKQILLSLYYPSCPYEFSVLWVDILGNIYEKFLGKTLVKEWRTIKTEFKPDVKKAWGVFYTPQYIVDYIVKNTVGELLKWKTPKQALEVNIVDPACGSGAFLIWAYDYILNRFLEQHTLNDETIKKSIKEGKIYQFKSGYHLSFAYKKEILKNMIYGVDIDRQAVAVSRLSLLLKLLEWETAETANQLFSTIDAALLPKLDNNIKCGNSLVDSSIYTNLESPDETTIKKINAFDWEKEFAEVFVEWGFDAVIGNPPYVDIKWMDKFLVEFYFAKYKTCSNRINLYAVFVEKAISILAKDWKFSFIIPSSIITQPSYKELRKYILENTFLCDLVKLPDNVFEWVNCETCIIWIQNTIKNTKTSVKLYSSDVLIHEVSKENAQKSFAMESKTRRKNEYVFSIFNTEDEENLIDKIWLADSKLENHCEFCLWLTPYDKYKWHTPEQINNKVFHSSSKKDETFKPLLSWKNIQRYYVDRDWDSYISYGDRLWAPRELKFFVWERIFVRQIVSGNPLRIYAGLTEKEYYIPQIGFSVIMRKDSSLSLKFILGIINSKLINFYHTHKYLDIFKNTFQKILIKNAKEFPIPTISESQQQPVIELVDQMLLAQKKLREAEFEDDKKVIQKQIEIIDEKIDGLVFNLYGLSEEERKLVLGD